LEGARGGALLLTFYSLLLLFHFIYFCSKDLHIEPRTTTTNEHTMYENALTNIRDLPRTAIVLGLTCRNGTPLYTTMYRTFRIGLSKRQRDIDELHDEIYGPLMVLFNVEHHDQLLFYKQLSTVLHPVYHLLSHDIRDGDDMSEADLALCKDIMNNGGPRRRRRHRRDIEAELVVPLNHPPPPPQPRYGAEAHQRIASPPLRRYLAAAVVENNAGIQQPLQMAAVPVNGGNAIEIIEISDDESDDDNEPEAQVALVPGNVVNDDEDEGNASDVENIDTSDNESNADEDYEEVVKETFTLVAERTTYRRRLHGQGR
jgi:hypothetical protein